MRYNPDTDRAIDIDAISAQCGGRVGPLVLDRLPLSLTKVDLPAEVEPEPSEVDKAISAITYNLWGTSSALARLTRSEVGESSLYSLIRDVEEVVTELRKLCIRV